MHVRYRAFDSLSCSRLDVKPRSRARRGNFEGRNVKMRSGMKEVHGRNECSKNGMILVRATPRTEPVSQSTLVADERDGPRIVHPLKLNRLLHGPKLMQLTSDRKLIPTVSSAKGLRFWKRGTHIVEESCLAGRTLANHLLDTLGAGQTQCSITCSRYELSSPYQQGTQGLEHTFKMDASFLDPWPYITLHCHTIRGQACVVGRIGVIRALVRVW